MLDLRVLKEFNIVWHAPNATMIKEVLCQPPLLSWVKCNNNCGSFRCHYNSFLGEFLANLGVSIALCAKLTIAIIGYLVDNKKSWTNIWLEFHSNITIQNFNFPFIVSWNLRNRWSNFLLEVVVSESLIFIEKEIIMQKNLLIQVFYN